MLPSSGGPGCAHGDQQEHGGGSSDPDPTLKLALALRVLPGLADTPLLQRACRALLTVQAAELDRLDQRVVGQLIVIVADPRLLAEEAELD